MHHQFHTYYQYHYPEKPGRKPTPSIDKEIQSVLAIRKQHPLNALALEKILSEQGIHIGHNRIHRILKEAGLVKDDPINGQINSSNSKPSNGILIDCLNNSI